MESESRGVLLLPCASHTPLFLSCGKEMSHFKNWVDLKAIKCIICVDLKLLHGIISCTFLLDEFMSPY